MQSFTLHHVEWHRCKTIYGYGDTRELCSSKCLEFVTMIKIIDEMMKIIGRTIRHSMFCLYCGHWHWHYGVFSLLLSGFLLGWASLPKVNQSRCLFAKEENKTLTTSSLPVQDHNNSDTEDSAAVAARRLETLKAVATRHGSARRSALHYLQSLFNWSDSIALRSVMDFLPRIYCRKISRPDERRIVRETEVGEMGTRNIVRRSTTEREWLPSHHQGASAADIDSDLYESVRRA